MTSAPPTASLDLPEINPVHWEHRDRLLLTLPVLVLTGCVSLPSPTAIDENYRGQLLAAITPCGGQTDNPIDWALQQQLQQQLVARIRRGGVFSGVEEIDSPNAPNEAEVILEPSLLVSRGNHRQVAVHLRARRKTSGRTDLNQNYLANCDSCAAGELSSSSADALAAAINNDLHDKYGRTPLNR